MREPEATMNATDEQLWIPVEPAIDTQTVEESAMYRYLRALIQTGRISGDDSFLVVFGGEFDRVVMRLLELNNVTVTNKSNTVDGRQVDARLIPFPDGSFDHVVAHAGIHHCSRPHQAVCEMYRIALKSVMFFEAQDSWMMRRAVRLKLTADYEWNAILDHGLRRGGVDDLPIPNYVYRWTRREIEKLVRTLDPAHIPCLTFRTEWDFSYSRVMRRLQQTPLGHLPRWLLATFCRSFVFSFNLLFSRQGNIFFARIEKGEIEQSWMKNGAFVPPVRVASTDAPSCERS